MKGNSMTINIEQHPLTSSMKIVRRYRAGRVTACVWHMDTPDEIIRRDVANGWAKFRAYNESTGTFLR